MIVMIRLIVFALFLTAVNCQLAHIWFNYNLFLCSQNARNYHESVHHQYLCTSSFITTCILDVNEYFHRSVIVPKSFCGFIDGQNALQRHTVWNIHLKPNVNIHFLKFALFSYYWYCDYEYLRVSGNNKSSTFCGNRLPWVHDAAATNVNIILMTHVQRAGTKNYQLELLYFAAYVPKYKHFVILIQPYFFHLASLIDIHLPNTTQNAFESFHFISNRRLDIVNLKAINTCNKGQVVCYDGPGFKSPLLQFTYNQSVWECRSSTFQMMCKFSRVDDVCTKGSRLYYHATCDPFSKKTKNISTCSTHQNVKIDDSKSRGTTKYIYYYGDHISLSGCMIRFLQMEISFPYMLSEGNSCMYGGVYTFQLGSEMHSLSTSTLNVNRRIADLSTLFLIIIHYSEYSTERMLFYAEHTRYGTDYYTWDRLTSSGISIKQAYNEDTISITEIRHPGFIHSSLFRLRIIHYINISINKSVLIEFNAQYTSPCVNVTIFCPSNMRFILDHYKEDGSWTTCDRTTIFGHKTLRQSAFIESVVINMRACSFVRRSF